MLELADLTEVVGVSLGATLGITVLFSLGVRWSARSAEVARDGAGGAALGYAALALIALLLFAGVVILGVRVMLAK